jgi:hypothetical protein
MAVLELTKEQVFDLVRQMPAREKRAIRDILEFGPFGTSSNAIQ